MYNTMTSSLLPKEIGYMIGDSGYDHHSLYELRTKRGFELVCPVQRYEHTHTDRLELIHFYESELGQVIYSWRSKSIEPLIEHLKDVFRLDSLPVRGYRDAPGIVILSGISIPDSRLLQLQNQTEDNNQEQSNICYVVNTSLND